MENIPEKFLNKDGTLNGDALMKSYTELEKKMSGMISVPDENSDADAQRRFFRAIGAPENASEYPRSEMFDDENVRQKFLEIGLTSKQVQKIYDIAQEYLTPILSNVLSNEQEANAFAELKNFFGGTEKMRDACVAIQSFGERFLPADAFEELCATPQGIQSIYKMMQSMEPRVEMETNASENLSDSDLRHMMESPKYWRDHDAEYIRKIENGFKKLYS